VHHLEQQALRQACRAQDMQLVRMEAVLALNQDQGFDFDVEIFVQDPMPAQLY